MKNHKYYCVLLFAIHFHFSEIFADFLNILNYVDDCFEDILRRIYFVNRIYDILCELYCTEKAEICQICKINPHQN